MILAASSGWLVIVDKLSETTHTVTIRDPFGAPTPFTISKSDPDQKLFDSVDEATAWVNDHPARKGAQP